MRFCRVLGCMPARWHPQLLACWHAGMMASQRGRGAKDAGLPVLLGCTSACRHLGRGMLVHPSMQAPRSWHAGMLACLHAGRLPASEGGGPRMLVCLCCWGTPQHVSTPSCDILACWSVASQPGRGFKDAGLSVQLACTPACRHPQLLVCWHASRLADC